MPPSPRFKRAGLAGGRAASKSAPHHKTPIKVRGTDYPSLEAIIIGGRQAEFLPYSKLIRCNDYPTSVAPTDAPREAKPNRGS